MVLSLLGRSNVPKECIHPVRANRWGWSSQTFAPEVPVWLILPISTSAGLHLVLWLKQKKKSNSRMLASSKSDMLGNLSNIPEKVLAQWVSRFVLPIQLTPSMHFLYFQNCVRLLGKNHSIPCWFRVQLQLLCSVSWVWRGRWRSSRGITKGSFNGVWGVEVDATVMGRCLEAERCLRDATSVLNSADIAILKGEHSGQERDSRKLEAWCNL